MIKETNFKQQKKSLCEMSSPELMRRILSEHALSVVQLSSLNIEDQVITHMLKEAGFSISVAVIDTGRLPQETYDVMAQTRDKYDLDFNVYFPNTKDVEQLVSNGGPNAFYDSLAARKLCCHVRKVKPLERILSKYDTWITGLRREHSVTRDKIDRVEWDDQHNMLKVNLLNDWSEQQVWDYIKKYDIPYNKLHDQGYTSIGCAPCSRAIQPGESVRAGRWWWETPEQKECGLHIDGGKLVQSKQVNETGL